MVTDTKMSLTGAAAVAEQRASASGALVPLMVEQEIIDDQGVAFRVEWLSTLALKDTVRIPRAGDKPGAFNPFLPYEPDLYVADLSPTHVALLNKFMAKRGHLLAVTKEFVDQESPLNRSDFEACAALLCEIDGFVFYNSGTEAGASQRHRHLQIIPDFTPPIAALLGQAGHSDRPRQLVEIPYAHLFARFGEGEFRNPVRAAAQIGAFVGVAYDDAQLRSGKAYNLLMTRDWLLFVPRSREAVDGVSLSALSYAGLIGLRAHEQIETVRQRGPMTMLIEAAGG